MNISGVLVHAYPEKVTSVSRKLDEMQGIEVHASTDEGKIVVTVEQADDGSLADTVLNLQDMPGVLSASMIYHHFED
jgi:nitrate reductase NapD